MPILYKPISRKLYKYGIVCHYVDYEEIKAKFDTRPDILIINTLTNSVEILIDTISSCKKIISTSLHGLIVAHAYGIPALWWKYSSKLSGDNIKLYDYFESVEIEISCIKNYNKWNPDEIIYKGKFFKVEADKLKYIQRSLLQACPFKIDTKIIL